MKDKQAIIINVIITAGILLAAALSLTVAQSFVDIHSVAPMVFVLAVFLIALFTQGYACGVAAAIVSVFAVNYAFTFPYFVFNFSIPINVLTAAVMLCVSVMTSTLTTQIKKQEKEKSEIEAEKIRANLLRAVSHDLRTPLTSLCGGCSTIIENYDLLDKEKQIKLLGEMKDEAEWLTRMVENLLSITRVGDNKVSLMKSSIVLEELIETTLSKFRKRFPNKNVSVDIPDEFIAIPMDAMLIEQVLLNILENSVNHAQGMTELVLRVFKMGNAAIFEIADDGCGIPKDIQKTIFSGYHTNGDLHIDANRKSMGIGLSVCAAIVKAHDGDIEVQERKGGGTLIRFSLDMESEDDGNGDTVL